MDAQAMSRYMGIDVYYINIMCGRAFCSRPFTWGVPFMGKPTTSRTQLGTHKELAEIRMGHEQETRPVTQGIETLWLAT